MTRDMAVSRFEAEFGDGAGLTNPLIATAATIGVVVAGAALLEVALIPGLLIGGTAELRLLAAGGTRSSAAGPDRHPDVVRPDAIHGQASDRQNHHV
jgi:hypothetical protein